MGKPISVKVVGAQKLIRKLAAIPGAMEAAARMEVKVALLNVQNGARRRCPVRRGRLRNSIAHETTADGLSGAVGSNVEYAPYVEFGTRFMRAQPYLFPAFMEELPQFKKRLERALNQAAQKVASR